MATDRPATVEEWAPLFAYFGGAVGIKKFSDSQILDPSFMVTFGYCKLCDAPVTGGIEAHVKKHARELRAWRGKRAKEAAKRSTEGLKRHRREKAREADIEPEEEDE